MKKLLFIVACVALLASCCGKKNCKNQCNCGCEKCICCKTDNGKNTATGVPEFRIVENEQVDRVDRVKQVFRGFAMNKAALAVIHVDGDKGQTSDPAAGEKTAPDDRLGDPLLPKHKQEQDKAIAAAPVIRMENNGDHKTEKQEQNLLSPFLPIPLQNA